MTQATTDDITLEEGQVWEWDTDDDEFLLHDATVTVEKLFIQNGTPKVTFTEPADGLYEERTKTVLRTSLKQSLAENYSLVE